MVEHSGLKVCTGKTRGKVGPATNFVSFLGRALVRKTKNVPSNPIRMSEIPSTLISPSIRDTKPTLVNDPKKKTGVKKVLRRRRSMIYMTKKKEKLKIMIKKPKTGICESSRNFIKRKKRKWVGYNNGRERKGYFLCLE